MVETPKLSSLAGELLRFFFFSSVALGLSISAALYFFGKVDPLPSLAVGFAIAFLWVLFNLLWTKNKIEELLVRLVYIIDMLEERHKERMVVPIPVHEEVLEVVGGIRELVKSFEERYKKNIRELEEQIDAISENAAKILEALEELESGKMSVEFPTGLDPVGAIGQSIQHIVELYRDKFHRIKELNQRCRNKLEFLSLLLEEKHDKIDVEGLKEGIKKIAETQEEIAQELSFLKDI